MSPTSRLYNALKDFLRQCEIQWQDVRHLRTLCWMIIGMIQSQSVHLNGFGVYVKSRAQVAQSHQRRFRRWLSNRRIDVVAAHHALVRQALSEWSCERLYLSLDTSIVWNCICIVWVGVVYRSRTVPVAWRVVAQSSSTVRLWTIQRVLRQAQRSLRDDVAIVLLADRGFADGKLMKYLRENLGWHFRIRIKRSFQFQHQRQWRKVSSVQLEPGQAYFTDAVSVGKTKPCPNVYLAFAHDKQSGENWTIVSDEPTNLQTFAQYRLRFCVEENFLDDQSNGFNLQKSEIRSVCALSRLWFILAVATLYLTAQGVEVVESGKRRWVDPHWFRGNSYLRIGWNWVKTALENRWQLIQQVSFRDHRDCQPAKASRKQHDKRTNQIEFKLWTYQYGTA